MPNKTDEDIKAEIRMDLRRRQARQAKLERMLRLTAEVQAEPEFKEMTQ